MKTKAASEVEIKKCYRLGKWEPEHCPDIYEEVMLIRRNHSYSMDLMFARATRRVCIGFMVLGKFGK